MHRVQQRVVRNDVSQNRSQYGDAVLKGLENVLPEVDGERPIEHVGWLPHMAAAAELLRVEQDPVVDDDRWVSMSVTLSSGVNILDRGLGAEVQLKRAKEALRLLSVFDEIAKLLCFEQAGTTTVLLRVAHWRVHLLNRRYDLALPALGANVELLKAMIGH